MQDEVISTGKKYVWWKIVLIIIGVISGAFLVVFLINQIRKWFKLDPLKPKFSLPQIERMDLPNYSIPSDANLGVRALKERTKMKNNVGIAFKPHQSYIEPIMNKVPKLKALSTKQPKIKKIKNKGWKL